MTWNHRIVKRGDDYGIHEVYYDDDGEVEGLTADAISLVSEDVMELRNDWLMIASALFKPVIDYDTQQEIES